MNTPLKLFKKCSVCGESKSATDDFYTSHKTAKCKSCERERQAILKRNTPPEKWMFDRVRHRAKAEGKDFTVTVADIFIPTHCPILGIALAPVGEKQGPATPTLDRINSSLGYVPGNVCVLSRAANALKGNGTAEQHERIAAWMRAQGVK